MPILFDSSIYIAALRVISKEQIGFSFRISQTGPWQGKFSLQIAQANGHERIKRARLTNDALIATSAARTGVQVITASARDYTLLAQYCRLNWETR